MPNRRFLACVVVAAASIACTAAIPGLAAAPELGGFSPYGGQRGTEVEVTLGGARLADAQELFFYEPGIAVAHLEVAGPTAIKVKLAIAADCRLGQHAVRVRSATGISNLRTFSVGNLPEVKEVEPNNLFTAPQKIVLGCTVNGVADNEDVDYYAVEAKAGERIVAEVEGIRLGTTFFDPYLSILDANRFELATSDDAAYLHQDPACALVAPKDGTYVIQVRESAFAGNGACLYRLHVGQFPRPMTMIPAGGRPGQSVLVRWLGDVAGPRDEQVALPGAPASEFGLFCRDERGIAPSRNPFRLSDLDNALEVEPNDAPPQATPFAAPLAVHGIIEKPGDVDCFKFAAKKGQTFDVRVLARQIGSPLDSVLYVNRIGGAGVASNDDSGGPDSYLRFTAPEDDEYVIMVHDQLRQGGPDYAYRIEVSPVKPQLVLGLPERSQYVDTTISVPQGNRTAFLINAARADFSGDLNVAIGGLPPGVSVELATMAGNRGEIPVLLAAAPGTALAGALVDVVGRPTDANLPIEGHLRQRTSLVRGQNNIEVWNHYTDRMAVAVTAEAPFTINVNEPKVPIVRDGAMNLVVNAVRKEGFTAPIAVRLLYNPPGIGSSGSIVIPEKQTTVAIPITANGGAEIAPWRVAVLGEATVGDGPLLVSSQMFALDVVEPFLAFNFQAAAVEQGQGTDLVIKIEKKKDFDGAAKIELLGLPNEATTEPREITKDSAELVFPVKTTANSPAGRHKTVICRAVITANGEPIQHTLGTGELRIDTPLPPKANEPAPMPVAAAAPAPAAPPAEKRLSRLEKLRQEKQVPVQPPK